MYVSYKGSQDGADRSQVGGGWGGYPLPQALSDSPVNERWKKMSGLFVVSWIERIKLQYLGGFVFFLPN